MSTRVRAMVGCASIFVAATATATPYRLRGDALAEARAPLGLVALEGDTSEGRWLDAEAMLWLGAGPEREADVLVAAVRLRDPARGYGGKIGRFVLASGALRPVHLDGVDGRAELPWRGTVEAFAGFPVVPRFGARGYDWLAGGRLAQSVAGLGTVGLAFLHRRDHGRLSDQEIGLDLSLAPLGPLEAGVRAAYDLIDPGLSELVVQAGLRLGDVRLEAIATQRSPARILPATSVFSVLGDVASRFGALAVRWRAAPRLDIALEGGARAADDRVGEELRARARLRLDDRGAGALGLELRRVGTPGAAWSGVRSTLRVPLVESLSSFAELELAVRDGAEEGRGRLWPWGLAGLDWRPDERWELAAALEASASPEQAYAVDALVRVAYVWSGR